MQISDKLNGFCAVDYTDRLQGVGAPPLSIFGLVEVQMKSDAKDGTLSLTKAIHKPMGDVTETTPTVVFCRLWEDAASHV